MSSSTEVLADFVMTEAYKGNRKGVWHHAPLAGTLQYMMDREERIHFWIEASDADASAMHHLQDNGDNTWALFLGHIVEELRVWIKSKL